MTSCHTRRQLCPIAEYFWPHGPTSKAAIASFAACASTLWKAQVRLCARYRPMMATGKKPRIVVAEIAREMAAFLWVIGHQIEATS